MKRFTDSGKLYRMCFAYIDDLKKQISNDKKHILSFNLEQYILKLTTEYLKQNITNYEYILSNPKELFYFKKQKNGFGFDREFLEQDGVKDKINLLDNIVLNKIENEKLNIATNKYTNGKIKNFISFYIEARKNRIIKLKYEIANTEFLKFLKNKETLFPINIENLK